MRSSLHASYMHTEVEHNTNNLAIIVTPSAPVSPSYTVTSHATTSFSVLLEWARPLSDGGVGISNYTATLRSPYSLHTYISTQNKLYLMLLYNQMHTLQIIATNCAGEGPPANISNIYSGTSYALPRALCNI